MFEKWLISKDCYGNRIVPDDEHSFIRERFDKAKDVLTIFRGELKIDQPNNILIDITHFAPSLHGGKRVIINLAHFIRPCPCEQCDHKCQFECYLEDCACCTDECT